MMWLVRMALSVAVMALLMLVLGSLCFVLMNMDIFPAIDPPVVMSIWNYPGLSAIDMERRITLIVERAYSTTVNDIEHIESESIQGLGLIKIYFQSDTDIGSAIAQLNATSGTVSASPPQGTEPPMLLAYNAANVPVAQLNFFSDTLSGQQLFDYGLNFPGFSTPRHWRLQVKLTFDQSRFVSAALEDVVEEAATAAALVALMVLIFLGSRAIC
jgi:multidrug efflux pump subunit AcrB